MDDDDREHYAELLHLLGAVDGWLVRIDPDAERVPISPRSSLSTDDRRTDPYQLSHSVWLKLSHAVDHLNCLRTLLRDAGVIHMYAPYSLVRSALENASVAVWMLHPPRRGERVARRLQLAAKDIGNEAQARRLMGSSPARSREDRLDQLRHIARRAGVDETRIKVGPKFEDVLTYAGNTLSGEARVVPLTWRICSGIAHGDLWTAIGIAVDRVELPGGSPSVGSFRISANVQTLMQVTTFATHMIIRGWQLYDGRSRPQY